MNRKLDLSILIAALGVAACGSPLEAPRATPPTEPAGGTSTTATSTPSPKRALEPGRRVQLVDWPGGVSIQACFGPAGARVSVSGLARAEGGGWNIEAWLIGYTDGAWRVLDEVVWPGQDRHLEVRPSCWPDGPQLVLLREAPIHHGSPQPGGQATTEGVTARFTVSHLYSYFSIAKTVMTRNAYAWLGHGAAPSCLHDLHFVLMRRDGAMLPPICMPSHTEVATPTVHPTELALIRTFQEGPTRRWRRLQRYEADGRLVEDHAMPWWRHAAFLPGPSLEVLTCTGGYAAGFAAPYQPGGLRRGPSPSGGWSPVRTGLEAELDAVLAVHRVDGDRWALAGYDPEGRRRVVVTDRALRPIHRVYAPFSPSHVLLGAPEGYALFELNRCTPGERALCLGLDEAEFEPI